MSEAMEFSRPEPIAPGRLESLMGNLEKIRIDGKEMEQARRLARDPELKFGNSSVLQAEGMADSAGINLTKEEVRLYCALREDLPPSMGGKFEWKNPSTRAWDRSDHEILAAVLLESGDEEHLKKLVACFPDAFENSLLRKRG